MAFIGRKPTNAPLTSDDIPNGIIGAADLATGLAKLTWDTTAKTSGFTAVSNTGYFCNTTSAAFTITLPSTPTAGDSIQLVDYAGTFATNNITLGANSNKINGVVANKVLTTNRESVTITYVDSTQGWVSTSASNYGTVSLDPAPYSIDFLVIAGGGGAVGGGGGAGGYRNSYSTETSGGGGSSEASLTFNPGTVYTITVGAGGGGRTYASQLNGVNGSDSSISGTGITTITSTGGGGGNTIGNFIVGGNSGGSGGGGGANSGPECPGGSGTANQGFAGGSNGTLQASPYGSGGGGGAGQVGVSGTVSARFGNGGNGLSSSITGSSVSRGGGGGGGSYIQNESPVGTGGTGGGGNGSSTANGSNGTVNTGGGGGGTYDGATGGSGGSGVVILRMPTSAYSGTTTGSPTVTTSGSDTILVYNASGSYTG